MYTRAGQGAMAVVNEPSDGGERKVANGFGLIVYTGVLPPVIPLHADADSGPAAFTPPLFLPPTTVPPTPARRRPASPDA